MKCFLKRKKNEMIESTAEVCEECDGEGEVQYGGCTFAAIEREMVPCEACNGTGEQTMNKQDALAKIEELKSFIEDLDKPKMDFSKLPKDTVLRIIIGSKDYIRYFSHYKDGKVYCYTNGYTSRTGIESCTLSRTKFRFEDNPPVMWFGEGECPIPDGIRVRIFLANGNSRIVYKASVFIWTYAQYSVPYCVTGFKILDSDWIIL